MPEQLFHPYCNGGSQTACGVRAVEVVTLLPLLKHLEVIQDQRSRSRAQLEGLREEMKKFEQTEGLRGD